MAYDKNILLGRITKLSGYEGAVAVKLEKSFIENIPQMESVFLEIEGRPVPFFISVIEYSGADILKLGFEGYDSIGKVSEFVGCRIFLTTAMSDDNDQRKDDQNIVGYLVFIEKDKLIGPITDIISNNGQWLLSIILKNRKEILIPFHEDFIVSIDKEKKIVIMDIPEGLTEIN